MNTHEIILKDYGWCKVIEENGKYFLIFDEGQITIKMIRYQIAKSQASLAIKNEIEAEKIARAIQNEMQNDTLK